MIPPTLKVLAMIVTVGFPLNETAPVPKFNEELPVKVKLPFQFWALLFGSEIAEPKILSIVVPASMVNVPVPKAPALLMSRVPALNVSPPLKLLLPDKISVPAPALVMLSPEPEMIPPTVKVSALTVTVGLAFKVTAPSPRFKLLLPVKVKLPFQFWALLFDRVIADPEALSIVVPAAIVKAPVPKAAALLISKVPALKVTPPLKLLLPDNASVPAPALASVSPEPEMIPPTLKVLALTVTVLEAFIATAPVPIFKLLLPVKVKLPFQFWALLLAFVMAAPEVLSIVVPLSIVKFPVPKAPALLISKVPALKRTPPLKLLFPDKVSVPAETVILPVPVPTAPLSTKVPLPAFVIFCVPLIAPPTVKVLAVTVTVGDAFKVTAPKPRFKLLLPVKVKLPFQI